MLLKSEIRKRPFNREIQMWDTEMGWRKASFQGSQVFHTYRVPLATWPLPPEVTTKTLVGKLKVLVALGHVERARNIIKSHGSTCLKYLDRDQYESVNKAFDTAIAEAWGQTPTVPEKVQECPFKQSPAPLDMDKLGWEAPTDTSLVTRCLAAFFDTPGTVSESMKAVIKIVQGENFSNTKTLEFKLGKAQEMIAALESENVKNQAREPQTPNPTAAP